MTCTTDRAATAVRKILACYPISQPQDPTAYATALVMTLEGQPVEFVERIENPRGGIASRCRFLPTVAEVKAMLDELWAKRPAASSYFSLPDRDRDLLIKSDEDKARVKAKAAEFRKFVAEQGLNDEPVISPVFQRAQRGGFWE